MPVQCNCKVSGLLVVLTSNWDVEYNIGNSFMFCRMKNA